ncbi:MAG: hypothetical protein K2M00_00255, partial [Muribaculaceae bacterium]|nr:hypothetical protein [Muribaculaceae bacterium]
MKRFLSFLLLLTVVFAIEAQQLGDRHGRRHGERPRKPAVELIHMAETYEKGEVLYGKYYFEYFYKELNPTDTSENCVIIYLHGNSGRNRPGRECLTNRPLKAIEDYMLSQGTKGVVIAPHCPADADWKDISGGIMNVVDSIVQRYNVDKSRIYLIGTSFGAGGAATLLSEYPDTFAGALLASGGRK